MDAPTRRECVATTPDAPTSLKISAGCGYLLNLSDIKAKSVSTASNSTASTCSDLDISGRMSTVSSNESNASEEQNPESISSEDGASPRERESFTRMPVDASSLDQTVVLGAAVPVGRARSFCRQAFAEANLDNLDDELADLTKDLEALRSSMAKSKRVLFES